jgi:hypothetical protein
MNLKIVVLILGIVYIILFEEDYRQAKNKYKNKK